MKTILITLLVSLLALVLVPGCRHAPPPITPSATSAPNVPVSLPAGTTVALRTAQTIDSKSSPEGQTFAAVVSRNIDDIVEQTVLPSGSPATLILLRVRPALAGGGAFELGLASVTLNGGSYLVRNELQGTDSQPGARLGTFIGGVPGTQQFSPTQRSAEPPRQLTTSGERVFVPVGSLLTFRLERPILLIGSH